MRVLLAAAVLAVVGALVVQDNQASVLIGKESLANADVKTKQVLVLKLLNQILQPTVYEDIKEVAQEWSLEDNIDKYQNADVVKNLINTIKTGILPKGEVFVHTNNVQMQQAVTVFRVLYAAKDFDVFLRTASWLRERINPGMFVHALTAAVFHRVDTRGIILPAPYEIYPYLFVSSDVINKAFMLKMSKAAIDSVQQDYYNIKKIAEKNLLVIESRNGVRHTLSEDDRVAYFTEDIDLNTYLYYLHMNYPFWLKDDADSVNKERRGEVVMYTLQQLLARLRLERLSHEMCDIKMINLDEPLEPGYWPKIRLHTGDEMPVRQPNKIIVTENNINEKLLVEDIENIIRESILSGEYKARDGTIMSLKKPEDIENLGRLIMDGIGSGQDSGKVYFITNLLKKVLGYSMYNDNKESYIPSALDMYMTSLRDPVYWKLIKRIMNTGVLFKKLLPRYTRDQLNFPGVKIESVTTDKLVSFMDDYDMDITNAVYLDETELKNKKSDMLLVARQRRLNNQPFKINIDVTSDKSTDAVVRVFLGPKYDCMGRLLSVNDKRLDMVEIDNFLYKLQSGKNTIVRNSIEMNNIIEDRPWTRSILEQVPSTDGLNSRLVENWWAKTRVGFPRRLLLPLGRKGGLPLQLYVILTPVRTGLLLPNIDTTVAKDRQACLWTSCIDTTPLGYPFDRDIDQTQFFTSNMKFADVLVYRKDLATSNVSKNVDVSDMVMKRDDLTYLDQDMLVKRSYREVMMSSVAQIARN